jgi:translation initiation factor IF-1
MRRAGVWARALWPYDAAVVTIWTLYFTFRRGVRSWPAPNVRGRGRHRSRRHGRRVPAGSDVPGRAEDEHNVLAHQWQVQKNVIKILLFDRVLMDLSPYDLNRGRILFRYPTKRRGGGGVAESLDPATVCAGGEKLRRRRW